MIDLQGAFLAPPEYDLVCLLRDSYVELPDAEVEAHCARIRPALPDAPDCDAFAHRFDLLTLTRKAKDHARFLYAAGVRHDFRYLPFVPATVRFLHAAAARAVEREPELRPLAEMVAALPEDACAQ
jgi:aminoglycoside/choline kinase family phosphotransferase